jgi:hypothetical protein
MEATIHTTDQGRHLALLSREHFEDVLFVWKIRQGVKNGVAPARISAYADWFWKAMLQEHFRTEEQEIRDLLPADHPLLVKLYEEHEAIAQKLASIAEYPSSDSLLRLARIVECHVRFEEGYLFRVLEQKLNGLNATENNAVPDPAPLPDWRDKFWMSKN